MLFSDKLFQIYPEVGPCSLVSASNLPESVATEVSRDLPLSKYDTLYVVNWLKCGHYKFTPKCFVVYSTTESIPQFGRVLRILSIAESNYFVLHTYEALWFDEHFNSYEIRQKDCETL